VVLVVDEWYMASADDPSLGYTLGLGGAEFFSPVISCFRRWFSRLGYKPISPCNISVNFFVFWIASLEFTAGLQ
jgi:hypothetical protein